ncbi:MAG TPA: hypothetical protein VJ951_13495 [Bacteroidales bacterium]|nr:hypothetical protein [Bacteroidales bacterium]
MENKFDQQYSKAIIECAKEKLETSGKPLSDAELLRGVIHLLKKKIGKDDKRHTSKSRFKKDYFKEIIDSSDWKKVIYQLPDKKFSVSKEDYESQSDVNDDDIDWSGTNYDQTVLQLKEMFLRIDEYRFEYLVKQVFERFYPDYSFRVTKASGDMGIDIIGETSDKHYPEKT